MAQGRTALAIVRKYYPNISSIKDATKSLSIKVTADDCKSSRRKSPDGCPMAQACKRSYDGAIIAMSTAYLVKGNKAIRFTVPAAVSREIVSFDRHHDFAVGTYKLNKPSKGYRLGRDGRKRDPVDTRPKRDSRGILKQHRTAGIRAL